MATFTKILAFNAASKSYNNVACDSNGTLNVNVVSGGGGGGGAGDASAANQLTQIQVAQDSNIALYDQMEVQADRLIYDLNIIANRLHDISGTVEVSNQITGYATSQLQTDSNLAVCSRLSTIATAAEDTLLSVDGINTKLNALQLQQAKYTIEAAASLAPDTTPQFTVPPTGIEKSEGWYFKNQAVSQPSQVYYYSYTNQALAVPARQHAYQLNDIACGYAVVRILACNETAGLPTLGIYTRPTGSGDAFPGYYKSKKVYTIPSSAKLTQGMKVLLWWGLQPSLKLHPDVARIELQLSSTVGPAAGTELLAYLTVNTDSLADVGNAEYILSAAGFQYADELIMDSEFTGESSNQSSGSDATAANQTLQLNAANNSNLALSTRLDSSNSAVCSRLDKQTYTNSNLHVRDDYLASQVINLATNIGNGTYTLMETIPPVSGGVRLTGFTDGNLFVYDSASNGTITLCKEQLENINASLDAFKDGTSQMWVHMQAADDSVEIHGYNTTTSAPEYIESVDHSAKVYVNNVVDSLLLAKNPVDNNVSLLTDIDQRLLTSSVITGPVAVTGAFYPETQPVSGTVGISGTVPVSGTFWQETQPVSGTVGISGTVPVSGTFWQETQPVSISGTVPISSGLPLDTHIYGSSDGTTWHHIKTNTNGVVATNAIMETDANGALTSTVNDNINALDVQVQNIVSANLRTSVGGLLTSTSGGTTNSLDVAIKAGSELKTTDYGALTSTLSGTGNSVHSLDVAVKNNVAVENVASTQLAVKVKQFGSYNNLVNNETIGPYSAGTQVLNIADWSYIVGYYTDIQGSYASYPDSRRLQFSFDGITWINLFNLTINPSQIAGVNVASIYKTDVPAVTYVRFYNDTSLTLASVNCTIVGATCT